MLDSAAAGAGLVAAYFGLADVRGLGGRRGGGGFLWLRLFAEDAEIGIASGIHHLGFGFQSADDVLEQPVGLGEVGSFRHDACGCQRRQFGAGGFGAESALGLKLAEFTEGPVEAALIGAVVAGEAVEGWCGVVVEERVVRASGSFRLQTADAAQGSRRRR